MDKGKPRFKKCPRCELNYIKANEEYCPVCLAELRLCGETSALEDEFELCPVCGQNFITSEQTMCEECAKAKSVEDDESSEPINDAETTPEDDWQDDEPALDDDVELVSFSDLEAKEDEEDEEDDNGDEHDPLDDDFNYDVNEEDFLDDDYNDEEDDEDDYADDEDDDE